MTDECDRLRAVLASEGIAGAEDLGRFVSNVEHFRPSAFDERAAMPILLREVPGLTDRKFLAAVAGHLARP